MTTLVSGLAIGAVYGSVGVAVATVALATRTLHLAVGAILVLGTLATLLLGAVGVAPVPAIVLGMLLGALVSAALEPTLLRPLRARDEHDGGTAMRWLVGLAVAAAVLEAASARWLTTRQFRPRPLVGGEGTRRILGTAVPEALLVAAVVGAAVALALGAVAMATRWGRRLRLTGGSEAAAELSGVDPGRVRAGAMGVGGAVAVLAGLLIAPVSFVGVGQAGGLTLRGVAAGVVLGVGGPLRALAAGVALGVVEAVGATVWPAFGGDLVVALAVIVALAARGRPTEAVLR